MRRRRVLFLTASYPTADEPLYGVFVKEHLEAVAPHSDVAVVHLDRREGVRALRTVARQGDHGPEVRVSYPHSPAPASYAGNLAAALAGYRAVRRRGFAPEVLHAHFFLAGIPAVLLGRALRTPVVVTEQWSVFLPSDPAELSPLLRRAARFAFANADRVLPVSEALRDGIRQLGVEPRFEVVPNVVDLRLFHPPAAPRAPHDGRRRVLSVGALYEAKGWEFLLEATALLAERRGDLAVEVVGDGPLRGECERLARRLRLEDVVRFRGWATKQEVAEEMRAADLFVLTSRYDSNPCALIEALASGLPAVATAVGGIPEMIRDGMGLLAEPQNPRSIAAQIEAALDRPTPWDGQAIAAAARERYSSETVGRRLSEIYDEVLAER